MFRAAVLYHPVFNPYPRINLVLVVLSALLFTLTR